MGRELSIIYKMAHLPTGKFYIGSLKDSSRFSSYVTSSKYVSRMMKDKPEDWRREIIQHFANTPFQEVVAQEQRLIEKFVIELGWDKIWNKFYHSGVAECYSDETVIKRNAIIKSPEMRKIASERTKIQMSKPGARKAVTEGQMGEKNHFYGKHHSAEHIARLRSDNPSSRPEVGAKIAEAQRGRKKMFDSDGKERRVRSEEVEARLKEGWVLGAYG